MGRWWWSGDAERIAQLWETVRRAAKLRKSWQHERADAVHEVLASVGGVDPFWIDGSFIEYVRRALQPTDGALWVHLNRYTHSCSADSTYFDIGATCFPLQDPGPVP